MPFRGVSQPTRTQLCYTLNCREILHTSRVLSVRNQRSLDSPTLPYEPAVYWHGRSQGSGDVHHKVGIYSFSYESSPSRYTYGKVVRLALSCIDFPYQTPIVSLASTQSTLLSHQVYLTDRIDNRLRDPMPHMKCVCFLQPSEASLEAVCAELRDPKYGEYYLCQCVGSFGKPIFELTFVDRPDFSNVLSKSSIERLAEVDEFEVVREVQVLQLFAPCSEYS